MGFIDDEDYLGSPLFGVVDNVDEASAFLILHQIVDPLAGFFVLIDKLFPVGEDYLVLFYVAS